MTAEMYRTGEAAAYLGMSVPQLRLYIRTGRLAPDLIVHSRLWFFKQATLDRFKAKPKRPVGRPRVRPQKLTA